MRWIALLLGLVAAGCAADPQAVIEERNRMQNYAWRAQLFLDKGQYVRAQHQAERALDIDDEYAKARLILGNVKFVMAQQLHARANRLDKPAEAEAIRMRADSLDMLAEAEENLMAVTTSDDTNVAVFKAYFIIGELYFYKHRQALRESVRLEKAGASEVDWQAYADEADQLLDLSVRYYQDALLTSHQRFDAAREKLVVLLYDRGRAVVDGADYDEALRQAGLYIDKATTDEQVQRERLAEIPKRVELTEPQRIAARQDVEVRLRQLHINITRMHEWQARLHARRDETGEAAEAYRKVITREPNYSLAYWGLGLALAKSGAIASAHVEIGRFLAMREEERKGVLDRIDDIRLSADAAQRKPEFDRLQASLEKIQENLLEVPMVLALLDCRLGRYREARTQLDRALLGRPDGVAAVLLAVVQAVEAGGRARALTLLQQQFEPRVKKEHPLFTAAAGLAAALRAQLSGR